jgi:hypothetical protein
MATQVAIDAAYEAYLASLRRGEDEYAAVTKAIEAADARRARAVVEALARRVKAA